MHISTYLVVESNHFFNNIFVNGWKQSTGNELHVYHRERIHKDLENPKITRKKRHHFSLPNTTAMTYVMFLFNTKGTMPQKYIYVYIYFSYRNFFCCILRIWNHIKSFKYRAEGFLVTFILMVQRKIPAINILKIFVILISDYVKFSQISGW